MTNRLLDRQLSLVEYLTSRTAIFGDDERSSSPVAPAGLDLGLLVVEARFGYAKRMEKITAVLPKTFELLAPPEDKSEDKEEEETPNFFGIPLDEPGLDESQAGLQTRTFQIAGVLSEVKEGAAQGGMRGMMPGGMR